MSERLPVVSGAEAVKAFQKAGYGVARPRGSHVRLIDEHTPSHRPLTVPLHRELDRGLLRDLLRDANLTVAESRDLL